MNRAVALDKRRVTALVVASAIGLALFLWPLWIDSEAELAHSGDAALMFAVVVAMLIVVLAAEISHDGLDAKALALLGILAALAAALRPLGSGISGFQPMFVILIIGGRVLGPGFGFALGLVSMFGSALLTGGVGPWLPFQMLGAAWLGMGAGLLPRASGKAEVALLAGYGAISGVLYGFLMNMWFWPFLTSTQAGIGFVPGDSVAENLGRFFVFCLVTSLGFDIPRAIGNVLIITFAGGTLLRSLRRVSRKAAFEPAVIFERETGEPDSDPKDSIGYPASSGLPNHTPSSVAGARRKR